MYAQQINGNWKEVVGNIVFSSTVFQTPESLSDAQRAEFGVFEIVEMPRPSLTSLQKLGSPSYVISGTTVQRTYPAVDKTPEEIAASQAALQADIVGQTQQRLDSFAASRNYASILSACTYATSPSAKFAIEGQDCVTLRDATWRKLYSILDEVQAGTRPVPSGYSDIEAELPVLAWTNN